MTDDAPAIVRVDQPARSSAFMAAKRLVQGLFLLLATPRLLTYALARRVVGERRAFGAASESIARIPGIRGVYVRQAFYRRLLASCGQDCYFGWNSVFSMPEAQLGERVYIGRFCSIGYAVLEDEVLLADGVQILSGGQEHASHDGEHASAQSASQQYKQVRIGKAAWIGARAVVMADVGAGAVIGAGAVVNRPIPADSIAVGVPAKVIKQRRS